MTRTERREKFIDESARKPSGEKSKRKYNAAKSHHKSFEIVLNKLELSTGDRFLELGCGAGLLLDMALKTAKSAAAIDHSPDMLDLTKKNNTQAINDGRAEIVLGNVESLPWPANSFSSVASANMFFFVEHPEVMLSEVYRVLEAGGRFAMITMNNRLLPRMVYSRRYRLRTYSNQRMIKMLKAAGFSSIEVESTFFWPQICYAVKESNDG